MTRPIFTPAKGSGAEDGERRRTGPGAGRSLEAFRLAPLRVEPAAPRLGQLPFGIRRDGLIVEQVADVPVEGPVYVPWNIIASSSLSFQCVLAPSWSRTRS